MSPPDSRPARRKMPLRHKLLLALACEILFVGFRQAERWPRQTGILIEVPAVSHHRIA